MTCGGVAESVHLDVDYPEVERDLNRWLPLVKWFLAIPHFFVLALLWLVFVVLTVVESAPGQPWNTYTTAVSPATAAGLQDRKLEIY